MSDVQLVLEKPREICADDVETTERSLSRQALPISAWNHRSCAQKLNLYKSELGAKSFPIPLFPRKAKTNQTKPEWAQVPRAFCEERVCPPGQPSPSRTKPLLPFCLCHPLLTSSPCSAASRGAGDAQAAGRRAPKAPGCPQPHQGPA